MPEPATHDPATTSHPDEPSLICSIAASHYAIPLGDVVEVTRAAAVATVPGGPAAILGYLDLRGVLVPVLSARRLLDLEPRALAVSDRFVVTRTAEHLAAIAVDGVEGIEMVAAPEDPAGSHTGLQVTRRMSAGSASAGGASAVVIRIDLRRTLPDLPRSPDAGGTP